MCHLIREDRKYIEAGENDNFIVKKLNANKDALGIFGFSFLEENEGTVQASTINGVEPTFENVSSGEYAVSRSLFVYAKNAHFNSVKGMKAFMKELVSTAAIGPEGYLVDKGLIPLHKDELAKMQEKIKSIK